MRYLQASFFANEGLDNIILIILFPRKPIDTNMCDNNYIADSCPRHDVDKSIGDTSERGVCYRLRVLLRGSASSSYASGLALGGQSSLARWVLQHSFWESASNVIHGERSHGKRAHHVVTTRRGNEFCNGLRKVKYNGLRHLLLKEVGKITNQKIEKNKDTRLCILCNWNVSTTKSEKSLPKRLSSCHDESGSCGLPSTGLLIFLLSHSVMASPPFCNITM